MSETKFTPAPWMVGTPDRELGSVLVGVTLDDQSYGYSIANVCSASPSEIDLTLADAHLIAAAPDLYAALQSLLDTLHANKRVYWNNDLHEAQRNANDALAKARGESK